MSCACGGSVPPNCCFSQSVSCGFLLECHHQSGIWSGYPYLGSHLTPHLHTFPPFVGEQAHGTMGACATALRFRGGGEAHVLQLAALATTDVTENRSRLLAVFHQGGDHALPSARCLQRPLDTRVVMATLLSNRILVLFPLI